MSLLVKFIAAENKKEIEHEQYVAHIFEDLCESGLIENIMLTPSEMKYGEGAVKQLDEEGNSYFVHFNSKSMEKSDNWKICFHFGTYNKSKQLEVTIESDTYIVVPQNSFLEKLKLRIKNCIVKDWNDIIWLIDRDSECLSLDLYAKIYKAENLLRELINEVMVKQYGTMWWDFLVPYDMKEKHKARLKEYKTKIPSFNNVDDRLMAIDIDDLGRILTLVRYKWNPLYDEEINGLLNGLQNCVESKLRELLEEQRVEDVNIWKNHFSKYLSDDFIGKFKIFARDRNHVMHNKLIDRVAYHAMKELATQIEDSLLEALEKQRRLVLSKEEKEQIERQQQIERYMMEELDHECRENDAGVTIRSKDEIQELFQESVAELVTAIIEELRFRDDIEIEEDDTNLSDLDGLLLVITSKIDECELHIRYDLTIADGEGEDSTLQMFCDEEDMKFITSINYKNAEVEMDEESGLYVPVIQDEMEEIDNAVTELVDFIEDELQDYREMLSPEDIADSVSCSECDEEFICINEDILPFGTCVNCGHVNELCQCDRCGVWFNVEWDGVCDSDGVAFCQNCMDEMEAE